MKAPNVQQRVREFFQVKSKQLETVSSLPACDHPGLTGSHREEIQRVYLSEVLPDRFSVSRGMVYGPFHRSHEADIVIWDSKNYPSLPMADHEFFFAKSVKIILEVKSRWDSNNHEDVLEKCRAAKDIISPYNVGSVSDRLDMLEQEVEALKTGRSHSGALVSKHHIGTAAIFLEGGDSLTGDSLEEAEINKADDAWPDALLLLGPGRVVLKNYKPNSNSLGGDATLDFYDLNEDSLLAFTNAILSMLGKRSVQVEDPLYLTKYAPDVFSTSPTDRIPFPLLRPVPNHIPLWRRE